MRASLTIPARFNGPMESGNGGYSSGVLAGLLDGPVEVALRRPVPLDRELEAVVEGGHRARVLDGEELIAEARAVPGFELDVPEPVGVEQARAAMSRYRGQGEGPFSRCFVCGLAREDGFGLFAGPVEGRRLLASAWTPPAWTAGDAGIVRPEFVWAALDCPTYFAAYAGEEGTISFLARMTAALEAPVAASDRHAVIAWPLGVEGRKRRAGSAVLAADGRVLARAEALLIEPRGG